MARIMAAAKLSQRFWEYHQTIDLLELAPDSVVLDIGGGSPMTGAGFFTQVIASFVKQVHVLDINIGEAQKDSSKIVFHRSLGSYETLSKLLRENPNITHVACISVFEHIPHEVRCGMVKAINEHFSGDIFVSTLEYHSKDCYFDIQLTTRTLSELFQPFTRFYPDHIRKSPVWCEKAFLPSLGCRILRRLGIQRNRRRIEPEIPLWYPLALRFRRMQRKDQQPGL